MWDPLSQLGQGALGPYSITANPTVNPVRNPGARASAGNNGPLAGAGNPEWMSALAAWQQGMPVRPEGLVKNSAPWLAWRDQRDAWKSAEPGRRDWGSANFGFDINDVWRQRLDEFGQLFPGKFGGGF